MLCGRRSARSEAAAGLGAVPASGATADGVMGSAMGRNSTVNFPQYSCFARANCLSARLAVACCQLPLFRFDGRLRIICGRSGFQPSSLQQWLDVGLPTHKILEQNKGISRTAAAEQGISESITILALQTSMFFDPLYTVSIEYFAPDIGVVTSGISTRKGVRKIRGSIPRRNGPKIDSRLLQRGGLKGQRILWHIRWIELVPSLIEQRRGKVLGRLVPLVELLRRNHLVEKLLRNRFSRLVMLGEIL